jgi:hypothetical protein
MEREECVGQGHLGREMAKSRFNGMQEVIWDKGGTEHAEQYGYFLTGGNISFSRTLMRGVSCSLSEIFACRVEVFMWSPTQRSRGCRIV